MARAYARLDTAGFLTLQGLFTAHVTGNFVTLGASLALGTSGAIAKRLAPPIFFAMVVATRLLDTWLSERHRPALETLLVLQVLLLVIGAALAIRFGPFHDSDSWRVLQMSRSVLLFAIGCGAAALLYGPFGMKCFLVPPVVGILQLIVRLIMWQQSRRDDDPAPAGCQLQHTKLSG